MQAKMKAVADKEAVRARDAFVGACVAMGSKVDASCFEIRHAMDHDPAKDRACRHMAEELERLMFAR
jgi:hypothetical protein